MNIGIGNCIIRSKYNKTLNYYKVHYRFVKSIYTSVEVTYTFIGGLLFLCYRQQIV